MLFRGCLLPKRTYWVATCCSAHLSKLLGIFLTRCSKYYRRPAIIILRHKNKPSNMVMKWGIGDLTLKLYSFLTAQCILRCQINVGANNYTSTPDKKYFFLLINQNITKQLKRKSVTIYFKINIGYCIKHAPEWYLNLHTSYSKGKRNNFYLCFDELYKIFEYFFKLESWLL